LRKNHPQKPDTAAPLGLAPRLFLKLRRILIFHIAEQSQGKSKANGVAVAIPLRG
jgi:hypothetical protein